MTGNVPAGKASPASDAKPVGAESSPERNISPICKKTFDRSAKYRGNWKIDKIYRCPLCRVRCSDVISLQVHVRFCQGVYPP